MTQHEPESALYETWAREFDLVIAEYYSGHAAPHHVGLDRVELTRDALRLVVPAVDEVWSQITSVESARHVPWVMEPRGAASRHWAEQACRRAGFEPDVRFETADLQAHLALIESGNAVALIPDLMLSQADPGTRQIKLPEPHYRTLFTSARRASRANPGIAAVRAALDQAVRTRGVSGEGSRN